MNHELFLSLLCVVCIGLGAISYCECMWRGTEGLKGRWTIAAVVWGIAAATLGIVHYISFAFLAVEWFHAGTNNFNGTAMLVDLLIYVIVIEIVWQRFRTRRRGV
jgi:uncharacterized membrane protein YedE/YeeE